MDIYYGSGNHAGAGVNPREESVTGGASQFDPLLLEAPHCSIYPGKETCNSGEDCWRRPDATSIGDNTLGHIVTHQRASGVSLWVMRGRTVAPGLPSAAALRPEAQRGRVGGLLQLLGVCEMGGSWGCRSQASGSLIGSA